MYKYTVLYDYYKMKMNYYLKNEDEIVKHVIIYLISLFL